MDSLKQLTLSLDATPARELQPKSFTSEVAEFNAKGTATNREIRRYAGPDGSDIKAACYINEYWTARQRQANSLHEISYRACFKPQLPRFFIERLSRPGEVVYDPFLGRGTTALEAALLRRVPFGCDINPLSRAMIEPRLRPPTVAEVKERLNQIDWNQDVKVRDDLLVFFHPETLREITSLRQYLMDQQTKGCRDAVDDWIALVGLNRLTGHSPGFFSVYTLPPNQAVSIKSQNRINERRGQEPPRRHVGKVILKKTAQLLSECDDAVRNALQTAAGKAQFVTASADATPQINDNTVTLVVTSPPFLNVVDYETDNWLRCWFLGIDPSTVALTVPRNLEDWRAAMSRVFAELHRILVRGGHVAFEVGEVLRGRVQLEEAVVPCGLAAGLELVLVMINEQEFTKTAHCWGVSNNSRGTNSNRVVVFRKP